MQDFEDILEMFEDYKRDQGPWTKNHETWLKVDESGLRMV